MKFKTSLSIFSATLLAAGSVFGQAVTDPVGFITLNVHGGGSVSTPKLSLLSPTLTRPILYQGVITNISTTTITVSGTPWAVGAFNGANGSHYVEIISTAVPARSGTMSDIVSTPTSNTVVTAGDLSVNQAAVGDTIRIRKDVTIADVFGANNTAGLLASDDPATADEILIYNGASSTSYFYYTGDIDFPAGWYQSSSFAPSSTVPIAPNEAVVIKRKAAAALSITSAGTVKTGNTIMAVTDGLNVLGTSSATGITLANSGLYTGSQTTGIKASDDPATGDEVILYTTGAPISYFYYTGDIDFPAGWYQSSSFAPSGNINIAAGTAFVVRRKGGVAFNWALPSPTSF